MRVGIGYDVHRLVPGRRLILGGVEIPHDRGLSGHSDADVLAHAVAGALLGAAGLGDVGQHFPDTDPSLQDLASGVILQQVVRMVVERGYRVENVDTVVIAEAPRLAPHREAIRASLARWLGVSVSQVNLQATTHEGVGALGRGEAIASHAVVALAEATKP